MGRPLDARPARVPRRATCATSGCSSSPPSGRTRSTRVAPSRPSWPSSSATSASTGSISPRLDRDELARLLADELGHEPDAALVDRTLERTDGNPFYAEQVVAASRETARRRHSGAPSRRRARPCRGRLGRGAGGPSCRVGRRDTDRRRAARRGLRSPGARRPSGSPRGRRSTDPRAGRGYRMTRTSRFATPSSGRSSMTTSSPASGPASTPRYAAALETRVADRAGWPDDSTGPSPTAVELAYHWDAAGDDARALPAMVEAARVAESRLRLSRCPSPLPACARAVGPRR